MQTCVRVSVIPSSHLQKVDSERTGLGLASAKTIVALMTALKMKPRLRTRPAIGRGAP